MDHLLLGLRAAGEKTRLRLLFVLSHGELNVKELTQILGQSQPRVSRHLKLLCEAGLLERYREGSWVLFRLAASGSVGALARTIVNLVPGDNATLRRDLQRLDAVRDARSRTAANYFKANAAQWDKIRSLHISEDEVEAVMRRVLGEERIGTLLDLGTGTGRVLELFADQVDYAIGIDSSQEMLGYARAKLEKAGLNHCQVRHGDLFHLPYDSDSKDVITIHQVLHFLNDPLAALQEAARVLKPGGRLVVVDFAPHELEFLRDEHAHRRLGISSVQMEDWLEETGLPLVEQQALPPDGTAEDEGLTVSIWLARSNAAETSNGGIKSNRSEIV